MKNTQKRDSILILVTVLAVIILVYLLVLTGKRPTKKVVVTNVPSQPVAATPTPAPADDAPVVPMTPIETTTFIEDTITTSPTPETPAPVVDIVTYEAE